MTRRPIARGIPRLALLALAWCTLTGGVFSGCHGLFTPVSAERPSAPPIIPNYRRPDLTLQTMIEAIQGKDQGADAWVGAFADSSAPADGPGFHLIFDPNDVLVCACPERVPMVWRVADERQFYLEFVKFRPSAVYSATFVPHPNFPDPATYETQVVFTRDYTVFATEEDGKEGIIAVGRADLTFTQVSTDRWLLTRWVDHVSGFGANPDNPDYLSLGRRRLE